jgi:hypothetical protein
MTLPKLKKQLERTRNMGIKMYQNFVIIDREENSLISSPVR